MTESIEELHARLNAETGKVAWRELERHFARGVIIKVSADLDLVQVAACVVRNDTKVVARWMEEGKVVQASATDAKAWQQNAELWAVVTAPWVLVQEIRTND